MWSWPNWFLGNTGVIDHFVPVLTKKYIYIVLIFGDYILKVCKIGVFPMKVAFANYKVSFLLHNRHQKQKKGFIPQQPEKN